jgi:hypothetical protein
MRRILFLSLVVAASCSAPAKDTSRCEPVSPETLELIQQGMADPITNSGQVKSKDYNNVWFVAGQVGDAQAVWASNGTTVIAVNSVSQAVSQWGAAEMSMQDDGAREAQACL